MSDSAAATAVRRTYQASAEAYDARWARYNAATMELLRPWLTARELGRVVDVGCGTGNLLAALDACDARVAAYVGVDLTPDMLLVARGKLRAHGSGAPAAVAAGKAGELPLPDGAFDTAVAASTVHGWPEPAGGLADVRRVLRPGGTLLLLDWHRDPIPMRILNGVMRMRGKRYRRMYAASELRALLAAAGFVVQEEARRGIGPWWRVIAFRARAV